MTNQQEQIKQVNVQIIVDIDDYKIRMDDISCIKKVSKSLDAHKAKPFSFIVLLTNDFELEFFYEKEDIANAIYKELVERWQTFNNMKCHALYNVPNQIIQALGVLVAGQLMKQQNAEESKIVTFPKA